MRKNLKEARQKAGMTQQEVAECLKIDLRTYQRIEEGETPGSIRVWDALEDLFGIPQRKLREKSRSQQEEKENMRKNLKEARQKAGMTQKQVAEFLGITLRMYQRLESGELTGSVKRWDDLEDLFGIPQRQLREKSQPQ